MRRVTFFCFLLLICLATTQLIGSKKRKKHKYKVVTPPPVCIHKQESVFSVTGFLTFVVVSATSISNVISNIDNNNNNNNNNDNNDNVNNNNQISDSADAMNMGNAKTLLLARSLLSSAPLLQSLSSKLCLPYLICMAVSDYKDKQLSETGDIAAMISLLGAAFGMGDKLCTNPLEILNVYRRSLTISDCQQFACL